MKIGVGLLSALLLLPTTRCGTINHTPKDFELNEPWPKVKAVGPVDVHAGSASTERFLIRLAGQSMTISLQENTEALVQRVQEALSD